MRQREHDIKPSVQPSLPAADLDWPAPRARDASGFEGYSDCEALRADPQEDAAGPAKPATAPSDGGLAEALAGGLTLDNPALDLDVRSVPGLSKRLVNSLIRHNLYTLRDAVALSDDELITLRGFGVGQLDELRALDMDSLSITAGHDLAPTIDRTPHLLLSAATPVQYLPLPHGVLQRLNGRGLATAVGDRGSGRSERGIRR